MRFYLCFLIAVSVSHSLFAQLPKNNGNILFEDIQAVPGITNNQLKQRIYRWISERNLKRSSVLGNIFIGIGSLTLKPVNNSSDWYVLYTISIEVKDNRYRMKISDFKEQIIPQKWFAEKTGNTKAVEYDISSIYNAYKENLIGIDKGPFESKKAWRKRTQQMITTIKDDIASLTNSLDSAAMKADNW